MTDPATEYVRMAAEWDEGGPRHGQPYGKPHPLAPGEPEFNPLHPSPAWLEWRYLTHWALAPDALVKLDEPPMTRQE